MTTAGVASDARARLSAAGGANAVTGRVQQPYAANMPKVPSIRSRRKPTERISKHEFDLLRAAPNFP
jgi:hypothetical protein